MELEITIATDTKQTARKAPAVVSVITAEDIKATGATNLAEVLEAVPGIHIRFSQFGFRPLVKIRGANDKQTLLMVNGTTMRDLMWTYGIFWKGLPTSIIDRVEIIRGPGSAVYGADASAGVINVITKTAGTIRDSEIGVRAGSFDTQTAWIQHGGNWNGFDVGFTADLLDTDGHDPFIAADRQGTPGRAEYGWENADLRMSVAKDHWRVLANYMRHSDLEVGMTGAAVFERVTHDANDSRFNFDLLYHNESFSDDWGVDGELRYQRLEYDSGDGFQELPPDVDYPAGRINRMNSAERRWELEVSGLYTGIDGHALRLGAGDTWQDLYLVEQQVNFGMGPDGNPLAPGGPLVDLSDSPYAFAPEKVRNNRYLFLQDIWTLSDDWELTAGARYEHYSDFGDTLNPRLALVWHGTDRLTTKLMFGQAFRAPNYQELFAETSFSLPNSGLEPERSETWDLSFSLAATKDLHLGLNLYYFRQKNLIRLLPVEGLPKWQFQNSGEHRIRGLELEARWQATNNLRISGNYAYNDPDDDEFRAIGSPRHDAYLRADWGFPPDWNWNLQANWVGERPRISAGDTRPPVEDYLVADTTLRYTGSKNWEFAASVRNLFDEDARAYRGSFTPNDLPLPERNFYAEIRYQF